MRHHTTALDPDTRGHFVRVVVMGGPDHPQRLTALRAIAADPGSALRRKARAALRTAGQ